AFVMLFTFPPTDALFTLLAIHGWRTWRRDPALREGVAA
ncbi:hypothetical protein T6L40_25445, partial [Pseudomonas aeruginosa]|nr:hypothetical protein [Pseudomonas aeruginosa]